MKKQEPERRTQHAKQAWETLVRLIQPTAVDLGAPISPAPPNPPAPDDSTPNHAAPEEECTASGEKKGHREK